MNYNWSPCFSTLSREGTDALAMPTLKPLTTLSGRGTGALAMPTLFTTPGKGRTPW